MGLLSAIGNWTVKAAHTVKRIATAGGHALRRFGAPIAGALRPLAHVVHGLLPRSESSDLLHGLVDSGLSTVGSGAAADAVHSIGNRIGDGMHTAGRALRSF